MPTLRFLSFYISVRHDSHDTSRTNSRVLFARDVTLLATYIVVFFRLSDYHYSSCDTTLSFTLPNPIDELYCSYKVTRFFNFQLCLLRLSQMMMPPKAAGKEKIVDSEEVLQAVVIAETFNERFKPLTTDKPRVSQLTVPSLPSQRWS